MLDSLLKNEPLFIWALEQHPDALQYFVSMRIYQLDGEKKSGNFDKAYGEWGGWMAVFSFFERLDAEKRIATKKACEKLDPEAIIRTAFELGFIDQAMRCQEALRRAQQK